MTITEMLLIVALVLLVCAGVLILVVQLIFLYFAGRGLFKGEARKHRESLRTSVFTLLGWIVFGTAAGLVFSANQTDGPDISQRVGESLFAGFEPIDVRRLEIAKYDAESNQFVDFMIEQQGQGKWRIPVYQNYPADKLEQVGTAANSLFNLTVIDVVPEDQIDHEKFGVIEPDRERVRTGQQGVGMRITLRDKNSKELANLIIGKTRKGKPGERYARIPGQEPVYIVEYDTSVLKTDFQDWINGDLLNIDRAEITGVAIKNYQIDQEKFLQYVRSLNNQAIDETSRQQLLQDAFTWIYNFAAKADFTSWDLLKFVSYDKEQQPIDVEIAENQELNSIRLDELAIALDSLKIVNVVRKPLELSQSLASGASILDKPDLVLSLYSFGIYPVQIGERVEAYSANGELTLQTNSGLEYSLRFGRIRTEATENVAESGLQRYLMVTARVNEEFFPLPIKSTPETSSGDNSVAPPTLDGGSNDDAANAQESNTQADIEYQNQVNARNEALRRARAKAREVNIRFADWYYVISEEAFESLKIKLDDFVIQKLQ